MDGFDRLELVAFDALDGFFIERRALAGFSERPVAGKAPGAAGYLGDLVGAQIAPAMAVELAPRSEGDMVDIHVEAHADGVGGDQEVHFAALVQSHLRVARARGKRAHHHRRPAAMAAQ